MSKGNKSIVAWTKPMRPAPPPRPPEEDCPDCDCPPPSQDGNVQGTLQTVLNLKGPDGRIAPIVAKDGGIPIEVMTNSAWPIYISVQGSITTSLGAGVVYNSNVNASAAIDGTKINPAFGAQNITGTSGISISGGTGSIQCGTGVGAFVAGDGSAGMNSTITFTAAVSITVKDGIITAVS